MAEEEQSIIDIQTFEIFKIDYEHQNIVSQNMFNSVLEAGTSTLKSAFILNGGATIAMLTLIGHLPDGSPLLSYEGLLPSSSLAALHFSLGAGTAVFAMGIKYLAQSSYYKATNNWRTPTYRPNLEEYEKWKTNYQNGFRNEKVGNFWNVISIGSIIISICLFFYGVYVFASTFNQL